MKSKENASESAKDRTSDRSSPGTQMGQGEQPKPRDMPRDLEQSTESAEPNVSIRKRDLKVAGDLAQQLVGELEEVYNGDIVGQVITTAMKLLRDDTNRGDLKLISQSLRELRYAMKIFAPYRDFHKVSIFGSARTQPENGNYQSAMEYGKRLEQAGWMVITGAGGGIMEAGHGGAGAKGSFGLNISLPFEQSANEFIHGDHKLIDFKYFFTRKLMFVRSSHAIACFPGGFGTMDEAFEVLTLIQTGKCPPMPMVFVNQPGGDYWQAWDTYVKDHLLADGLISPDDTALYRVTDNLEEAVEETTSFYRNYHSLRYTRDLIVLRMQEELTDKQVDEIREKFGDICVDNDRWRHGGPLKVERNESKLRHLHRLVFPFNRRDHGRLRMLIDHLNGLVK